jgi:Protein of unknown function (DUF3619)
MKKSVAFSSELEARMAAFGQSIARHLDDSSQALPHDVSERLRFAREQAISRARAARVAQVTSPTWRPVVAGGQSLTLQGGPAETGGRFAKWLSALPLALLVAGFLMAQEGLLNQEIEAAADLDTALLSDSVPPEAYSDPGFAEFLRDEKE